MKGEKLDKACYHLAKINDSLASDDFDPAHFDAQDVRDAYDQYGCAHEDEFKGSGIMLDMACYYANDEFEDGEYCEFGEDCWPSGCQRVEEEPKKGR